MGLPPNNSSQRLCPQPEKTVIVAPDRAKRDELTQLIRADLTRKANSAEMADSQILHSEGCQLCSTQTTTQQNCDHCYVTSVSEIIIEP